MLFCRYLQIDSQVYMEGQKNKLANTKQDKERQRTSQFSFKVYNNQHRMVLAKVNT